MCNSFLCAEINIEETGSGVHGENETSFTIGNGENENWKMEADLSAIRFSGGTRPNLIPQNSPLVVIAKISVRLKMRNIGGCRASVPAHFSKQIEQFGPAGTPWPSRSL
jgi:hypothetical protein